MVFLLSAELFIIGFFSMFIGSYVLFICLLSSLTHVYPFF